MTSPPARVRSQTRSRPTVLKAPPAEREVWSEELLDRLTPFMSALGVLFLLVVLAESFARNGSALAVALTVLNWVLWALFAAEFAVRLVVAPDRARFLRRNWWQAAFLVLPFLRFLRLLRTVRLARSGRVLSSAVRSSRSTGKILGDRIAWLGVTTAITVLAGSQLLHNTEGYPRYADALDAAALAAIAGEPLPQSQGWVSLVELVLVVYSVVVFATLAGALGAYFLRDRSG